jgi:DNA ligase D-like protein (predicted ligase)
MSDLFDSLDDADRRRLRRIGPDAPRPFDPDRGDWPGPMLATLTHEPFSDPGWVYERKLDGERCIAARNGDEVRLLTRNAKDLNDTYPELVDAIAAQDTDDFVVDGEIVAFDDAVTSFRRLQQRMQIKDPDEARASAVAVYLYLFDIPFLLGRDCMALPLRIRKRLLRDAVRFDDPLRFTPHRNEHGEAYLEEACAKGWEGLIAKRADAPYSTSRSRDWLKLKCVARQELVIGGFTEPGGSRKGFGALVVGFHDGDALVCAGKVGTGFDDETLVSLHAEMAELEQDDPPFDRGELPGGAVHWIRPELVAEIGFTEWTGDGQLRHPRFIGLRRDKAPRDVVREDRRNKA